MALSMIWKYWPKPWDEHNFFGWPSKKRPREKHEGNCQKQWNDHPIFYFAAVRNKITTLSYSINCAEALFVERSVCAIRSPCSLCSCRRCCSWWGQEGHCRPEALGAISFKCENDESSPFIDLWVLFFLFRLTVNFATFYHDEPVPPTRDYTTLACRRDR